MHLIFGFSWLWFKIRLRPHIFNARNQNDFLFFNRILTVAIHETQFYKYKRFSKAFLYNSSMFQSYLYGPLYDNIIQVFKIPKLSLYNTVHDSCWIRTHYLDIDILQILCWTASGINKNINGWRHLQARGSTVLSIMSF